MIKDILVYLTAQKKEDSAVDYSVGVAKEFGATASAISCAFDPVYPTTTPMDLLGADFIGATRAENKKLATRAIDRFTVAAKNDGLAFATGVVQATVAASAEHLVECARRSDLTILRQPEADEWEGEQIVETLLFESGRPIILVPYNYQQKFSLRSVLICWDGSRAAARAVGDALPLLAKAEKIFLVKVSDEENVENDDDIKTHLARHNIHATYELLRTVDGDEVSAFLNFAANNGVDLIVMGGYGHSRIREFVLGGVTRGILASMTAPVLMSH